MASALAQSRHLYPGSQKLELIADAVTVFVLPEMLTTVSCETGL